MSKLGSIVVGGVITTDLWADTLLVQVYSDPGYTNQVTYGTSPLNAYGTGQVQTKAIVFSGLSVGTTYYISARTLVSSTGVSSSPTYLAVLCGDSVPPAITYAYAYVTNDYGVTYTITPISYPSDIDHYEYFIGANAPTVYTQAIQSVSTDSSGHLNFFVAGAGTQTLWIRGVNTTGVGQAWTNPANTIVPSMLRVQVCSSGTAAVGSYPQSFVGINDVAKTFSWGGSNVYSAAGFNLYGINKTTGIVDYFSAYNVAGSGTSAAAALAAAIATLTNHVIVVLASSDTSGPYRLTGGLPAALYGIGGSRQIFGSATYKQGAAYALVGELGLGQGNGIELYSGASANDPTATCTTSFYLVGGHVLGYNATYASVAQVDGANGDISANGSIPPSISQAFTYTASSTVIQWNWNLNVYRDDSAGTVTNYNSATQTSSLAPGTKYYFFPYVDDNPTSPTYNTVYYVNQISGGAGNTFNAYPSVNYSCLQYAQRQDHIGLTPAGLTATTLTSGGTGTGGGSSGGSGTCMHENTLVNHKEHGFIPMYMLEVGDWIEGNDGWVEVTFVEAQRHDTWLGIWVENESEPLLSTPGHEWPTMEASACKSATLSLNDILFTKKGAVGVMGLAVKTMDGIKVKITVDSPDHCFRVGKTGVLTHNATGYIPC